MSTEKLKYNTVSKTCHCQQLSGSLGSKLRSRLSSSTLLSNTRYSPCVMLTRLSAEYSCCVLIGEWELRNPLSAPMTIWQKQLFLHGCKIQQRQTFTRLSATAESFHLKSVIFIIFCLHSSLLAVSLDDFEIQVVDIDMRRIVRIFRGHTNRITDMVSGGQGAHTTSSNCVGPLWIIRYIVDLHSESVTSNVQQLAH